MAKRFVSIWFRHLTTDRMILRNPALKDKPFVLAAPEHGRMVIQAANLLAEKSGIVKGMVVADARAAFPDLEVIDHIPGLEERLLQWLAEWCLRFTPAVSVDMPNGLILDVTGCAHLWGGEYEYLKDIVTKLQSIGFDARSAMGDTIGVAWAIARYGRITPIIDEGLGAEALMDLPPDALRLPLTITGKMQKLGLYKIRSFINMPRRALARRFGQELLLRLDQALGQQMEVLDTVCPIEPYSERLPCLEPIRTATGIEIALQKLLEVLCLRLASEGLGLRKCILKAYRIDGNIQQVEIGTNRPSRNAAHLFKLFETKIGSLEPDLGFELFLLEAPFTEDISPQQEALWNMGRENGDAAIAVLLDRIACRLGNDAIHRYLPAEHYWPERSVIATDSLDEKPTTEWRTDMPRPMHLLPKPEKIDVTVPIPDYPPMLFRYKGATHQVKKADGPERIEQEWWIEEGLYRDYYAVENEQGERYWLFRLGHYGTTEPKWFLHGFFT